MLLENQLEWLHYLLKERSLYFCSLLKLLNVFDTEYFFVTLAVVMWIGVSWQWGARAWFMILGSSLINKSLKTWFCIPRPCAISPKLALVNVTSYSFPSGGAQAACILAGIFMYKLKRRWANIAGISFLLIIGLSRVFLGVHYPIDILGGYLTGLIIVLLFVRTHKLLEDMISNYPKTSFAITFSLSTIFVFLVSKQYAIFFACISGTTAGLFHAYISKNTYHCFRPKYSLFVPVLCWLLFRSYSSIKAFTMLLDAGMLTYLFAAYFDHQQGLIVKYNRWSHCRRSTTKDLTINKTV